MLRRIKQSESDDRRAFMVAVECLQESQNSLRDAAEKLRVNLVVNGKILEKIAHAQK